MKKTGSKRGSGYDYGLGSAVLTAPEESYASEADAGSGARGTRRGPAPTGALQRGYGYDEPGSGSVSGSVYGSPDEPEYVPRRGKLRLRFRGLPRSVGGRIVFGVVVFLLLGSVAVAVAGVRYYLVHDSRFVLATTDDIQVTGAEHLTRDQVLTVFGADLERNIFRASLTEREADLERLPWVAHATVMRLLPDTVRVEITERTPVAFVRQGTQIGLVDASGVLLDMPPDAAGDPHYSFPVLTGLSADQPLPERVARVEIYQQFMRDLDSAGGHLTDSVSEVDVSDPEDVKALITAGSSDILVHFGQEQFLKRYQEFEQHLPEWRQAYPRLASADMRYEGQIVLEMQGDGDAASGGGTVGLAVEGAKATATTNTGVLRSAQDDGEKQTAATAKTKTTATATANTGVLRLRASRSAQDDGVKQTTATARATARAATRTTTTAKTNTGVLRLRASRFAQDDGEKQTTARAKEEADPYGMTTRKTKANATATITTATTAAGSSAGLRNDSRKAVVVRVKRPVGKRVVAKARAGSGVDAANQRVFAQLAAAHRAELAKEHKASTAGVAKARVAKNGRAGGKSGVTP